MTDPTMQGWVFLAAIVLFLVAVAGAVLYGFGRDATDWPNEEPTEEFETCEDRGYRAHVTSYERLTKEPK